MTKFFPRTNFNGVFFNYRSMFLYSTKTLRTSSKGRGDSLYYGIMGIKNQTASVDSVLDQWLEQGKSLEQSELQKIIKQLRNRKLFKKALEVSKWMSDQENLILSNGDVAIQLGLIASVHGLEQAEKYFRNIPTDMRGHKVYASLLSHYTKNKALEKAETLMKEMRELGLLKDSMPYNSVLHLYSHHGMYEKLDMLIQEMEENGIDSDKFTYTIRFNAYADLADVKGTNELLKKMEGKVIEFDILTYHAVLKAYRAVSDIKGMTKLLMKMEADPNVTLDSKTYIIAANGYLKMGSNKKALLMLERAEQLITENTRKSTYEDLLTAYAAAGKRHEVYRIWYLYKNTGKIYNLVYRTMIDSLVKLDDIDGAERILEEWESNCTLFDSRIPNRMIIAYFEKGMTVKAEAYAEKLKENGYFDATVMDCLATGYRKQNQMDNAVEHIKKSILAGRPEGRPQWKLDAITLAACFKFLREKGDMEAATKLLKLLTEHDQLSLDNYHRIKEKFDTGDLSFEAFSVVEEANTTFRDKKNENLIGV